MKGTDFTRGAKRQRFGSCRFWILPARTPQPSQRKHHSSPQLEVGVAQKPWPELRLRSLMGHCQFCISQKIRRIISISSQGKGIFTRWAAVKAEVNRCNWRYRMLVWNNLPHNTPSTLSVSASGVSPKKSRLYMAVYGLRMWVGSCNWSCGLRMNPRLLIK